MQEDDLYLNLRLLKRHEQLRELRIGNLIIDEHGHIHEMSIDLFKNIEINGWGEFIPLTEGWLLRCGYIKSNSRFTSKGTFDLFTYNNKYFHLVSEGVEIEIRHVHQLQNLYFALTGEELNIKDKAPIPA